jgi:hypothetical protein
MVAVRLSWPKKAISKGEPTNPTADADKSEPSPNPEFNSNVLISTVATDAQATHSPTAAPPDYT